MARAFKNVHQFANDPFSLRLIRSSNGSRHAATQMLFQYGRVYLLNHPLNRQRLLQNVDAIMVISDHSLNGGGVSLNGFPGAENSVCIAVQSDPIPARRKYQASPPGVDKSFLRCLSNDLTKYCPVPGTGLPIVRRRPEILDPAGLPGAPCYGLAGSGIVVGELRRLPSGVVRNLMGL